MKPKSREKPEALARGTHVREDLGPQRAMRSAEENPDNLGYALLQILLQRLAR